MIPLVRFCHRKGTATSKVVWKIEQWVLAHPCPNEGGVAVYGGRVRKWGTLEHCHSGIEVDSFHYRQPMQFLEKRRHMIEHVLFPPNITFPAQFCTPFRFCRWQLGMSYRSELLESNLLVTNERTMHLKTVGDKYFLIPLRFCSIDILHMYEICDWSSSSGNARVSQGLLQHLAPHMDEYWL